MMLMKHASLCNSLIWHGIENLILKLICFALICYMFDLKAHNVKAPLGSWACIHSRKNLHIGKMNWSIFSMKVSPRIRLSNLNFLLFFCGELASFLCSGCLFFFCNTNADFSFSSYSNLERQKIGR